MSYWMVNALAAVALLAIGAAMLGTGGALLQHESRQLVRMVNTARPLVQ